MLNITIDQPEAEAPGEQPARETILDWASLIRGEYCEMPGLCLTELQVERLWSMGPAVTRTVLRHLIDSGFLRRTTKGMYIRAGVDRA